MFVNFELHYVRRTLRAAIAALNRRVSHTLPAAIAACAARFSIGYRN